MARCLACPPLVVSWMRHWCAIGALMMPVRHCFDQGHDHARALTGAGADGSGSDARDLTVDHWRRVLDVDLYGVLYGMLAAYPIMARQGFGHIVNTASAGAFFPDPGNAPYCTAKHALIGLSLSLRLEGMDLGVRVSAACPGYVRTNIFENSSLVNMPARAAMRGRDREQAAGLPRRMVTADRAARVILEGVARNKPVILFPASIRWARRAYYLFPRLIGRQVQRWHRRPAHRLATPQNENLTARDTAT